MNNFMMLFYALFFFSRIINLVQFEFLHASRFAHGSAPDQSFFLFSKLKFSVSGNTVISFRSKKAWEFYFGDVLDERFSRGGSNSPEKDVQRSAQHYCKYLGPQLSHYFTTVETCQATK